jgi:hypothetical protein
MKTMFRGRRWRVAALVLLLIAVGLMVGCSLDLKPLTDKTEDPEPPQLLKVEIHFTDGEVLRGYVRELGVSQEGTVYIGGSSANYLYDASGNVIGVYNYNRVLYMKLID